MTLLGRRSLFDEPVAGEAEALIREARRLRHRRWAVSSALVAVLLLVSGLVVWGVSRDGGSGRPNAGLSTTGQPVGSSSSSAPLDRTSEQLTLAISERVDGKLVMIDLSREAIKFGPTSPAIRYLESESTAVNADGERNTTNIGGGAQVFVNGINFQQLASGKWEGTEAPGIGEELESGARIDYLQQFRQAAMGPVVVLGHAVIGGITTTEYRATLSLLKLYYLGQQSGPGLLGSLFAAVDPPEGLVLSLPVEIWADAHGNLIRASAQYAKRNSPFAPDGTSADSVTMRAATYTLSNFNGLVHAVAPPKNEVTFRPLQAVTAIAGKVSISGARAQSGVLELTMTRQGDTRPISQPLPRFVAVAKGGVWYLPEGLTPGPIELTSTFYADGLLRVECASRAVTVVSGVTTKNVNLDCKR